ncbi:hypothetical protein CBS101457_005147 [Exobasidium rhododendri]|nr:hypothetical protein CBS101457_005147 [Exobasidium rhododendri]
MASMNIPRRQPSSGAPRTQLDSHAAWHSKLDASIACLRLLLSPVQSTSKAWKAVNSSQNGHASSSSTSNAATFMAAGLDASLSSVPSTSQNRLDSYITRPSSPSVKVHKRAATRGARDGSNSPLLPPGSSQSADIYRAVCHVPLSKQVPDAEYAWDDLQDAFRRLLATPECRPLWDHMVEESEVIEELDAATRVCRTIFRLGWPASHRDAVTISKTMVDGSTLLDVSTSLPRSPDAPAYLRPAPPYVRSHVNLFAWCLQKTDDSTLKVTVFWSWDLKGAWLGMPAGGLGGMLPSLVTSLVSHVADEASRVPYLADFGRNVEVTSRRFDPTRDMIKVEYQVICEDSVDDHQDDEVLVWNLPADEGWDVHVDVRPMIASPTNRTSSAWQMKASREIKGMDWKSAKVTVRLEHRNDEGVAELEQGLRGTVTIQRIAASQEVRLRLNSKPCAIKEIEAATKTSEQGQLQDYLSSDDKAPTPVLDDAASVSGFSLQSELSSRSTTPAHNEEDIIKRAGTPSSLNVIDHNITPTTSTVDINTSKPPRPVPDRAQTLASLIRRNYIYFTSLLQEPEAKWKHNSDTRGVTITQLDSIDPTLVVYRAEATFVGVSVWDIYAAIGNAGVKSTWDKGLEETRLVEDLGDASKLWWTKIRAAWPVSSRDSVTVETSYKSPSSIHNFSFSTDDRGLFPLLPKVDLGTIRTQVDLRGWSIESLNPSTVHITLIEQSDPKGWTSKSSATPWAMTTAVAGVGDFAIKCGGPPIATRMLGAKTKLMKYEHDKGSFRLEYELTPSAITGDGQVECELRCDMETWASGLDLVVDPPPTNVSCLRRHKLSQGGSGLWLTVEHVATSLEDDTAKVTIRRASAVKDKGIVIVNGARIKVDIDELGEDEVAHLKDKKRAKPKRVPLDLVNSSPKKAASKRAVGALAGSTDSAQVTNVGGNTPVSRAGTPALPNNNDTNSPLLNEVSDVFSDERPRQPMTCALDVLFLLRRIHAERGPDPAGNPAGWALISQRNGLFVRRRLMQSISSTIHVQRGDKVVEGLTAEDILSAVSSMGCRKLWDEKVDTSMLLESFGNGATTGFFTTKASFPFRGRGFHLANLTARSGPSSMNLGNTATPTVFFHASASFPERNSTFSQSKLNPTGLPLGKVLIDGWILETLDPYSSTLNYQIPSTRCTHVVAVDYAGSLPITVNTMWNSILPRSILGVEEFIKSKGTLPFIRSPPCYVEVLGDGRDEDRNLIWNLEDDKLKRTCTMLTNTFNPLDKVYTVLVKMEPRVKAERHSEESIPAIPFPRKPIPLHASLSKATATLALASQTNGDALDGLVQDLNAATEDRMSSMSRATSTASIRSMMSKGKPSTIRTSAKKPVDVVVMDVEIELRHYEKGYEVVVSSELGSLHGKTQGEKEEEQLPLNVAPETAQALPLTVSSFDLPPSAVLAATLDPSARPRKHLLRVCLPTASLFKEAREDPLNGPEPEDAPKWFTSLRECGASIRLLIRPLNHVNINQEDHLDLSSPSIPSSEIDSQQVPVVFQGKKVQVTHVNQTSAMLQRESEKEEGHARLKKVAPSLALKAEAEEKRSENILDDRLPALLQYPIAAAKEMLRGVGDAEEEIGKRRKEVDVTPLRNPSDGHLTATNSTYDFPDPATPVADTKTILPAVASTPIMSILNSYPLSRLGPSTILTTAVANGGVFSKTSSAQAKDRLQIGAGGLDKIKSTDKEGSIDRAGGLKSNGEKAGEKTDGDMPGNLIMATEEIRKRLGDVRFSLSTLLLVAIIAFLVGSLARSLLEPTDFILVDSLTAASSHTSQGQSFGSSIRDTAREEIQRMLQPDSESNVIKRQLKVLLDFRISRFKHLIFGIAAN